MATPINTQPPFPESLCPRCAACRLIRGRASTFIMCTALPEKYPRQPVLVCAAFKPGASPEDLVPPAEPRDD